MQLSFQRSSWLQRSYFYSLVKYDRCNRSIYPHHRALHSLKHVTTKTTSNSFIVVCRRNLKQIPKFCGNGWSCHYRQQHAKLALPQPQGVPLPQLLPLRRRLRLHLDLHSLSPPHPCGFFLILIHVLTISGAVSGCTSSSTSSARWYRVHMVAIVLTLIFQGSVSVLIFTRMGDFLGNLKSYVREEDGAVSGCPSSSTSSGRRYGVHMVAIVLSSIFQGSVSVLIFTRMGDFLGNLKSYVREEDGAVSRCTSSSTSSGRRYGVHMVAIVLSSIFQGSVSVLIFTRMGDFLWNLKSYVREEDGAVSRCTSASTSSGRWYSVHIVARVLTSIFQGSVSVLIFTRTGDFLGNLKSYVREED
ncbi:uncharacterized protein LOC130765710 [Actinidia eriantha]|uniref:uncharacterized protein LOC130765710 n=1 Tax=Actinidia eriantha TaxID=165200 RepID=UPI00258E9A56|nr:uncharacterized protein LOC130765710 [Actinidia eriantha]